MIDLEKYANVLETTVAVLKSKSRKHEYVLLRQVIWKHLSKEHSYLSIAKAFNRSHPTIMEGVKRINGYIDIKDNNTLRLMEVIKKL